MNVSCALFVVMKLVAAEARGRDAPVAAIEKVFCCVRLRCFRSWGGIMSQDVELLGDAGLLMVSWLHVLLLLVM